METNSDKTVRAMNTERTVWSFSISTLFVITTIVAGLLGLGPVLGGAIIPSVVLGTLFLVCGLAYQANLMNPFWAATGAAVMCFGLVFPSGLYYRTETSVVVSSICFGIGIFLAHYAIRNGHWATKIYGVFLLFPYLLFICEVVELIMHLWPEYSSYWSG